MKKPRVEHHLKVTDKKTGEVTITFKLDKGYQKVTGLQEFLEANRFLDNTKKNTFLGFNHTSQYTLANFTEEEYPWVEEIPSDTQGN